MLKPHLDIDENGELLIGGMNTTELADRFGTPLYVIDESRIRKNYRRFYEAFEEKWDDVSLWYAYKANSNLAVCKVLQDEGCGAEVGSLCELKIALKVGTPGKQIIFNGNNKSESELELSIKNDVLINVDNLKELEIINQISDKIGKKARIGFRINPDVKAPTHPHISTGLRKSKFGLDVPSGKALEAYKKASKMENIRVVGIHSHIGSQILDPNPFVEQAQKTIELRNKIEEKFGVDLKIVDLGGGLGIPYKPDEEEFPPEELASRIVSAIEDFLESSKSSKPKLVLEPGRFIIADASLLLGRVGYVKERENTPNWVSIDVGMNALVRPALYGSYHHIEVANKMKAKKSETVNIAGPLCESGDYLGKGRDLPPVERGDLIAIYDAGAYGLSMSSQHTANTRPGMIMIKSGKAEIVRKAEDCSDLTRLDEIPEWLE